MLFKVAVAGLGNMGSKILPVITKAPGVAAIIGVDPDPAARQRASQTYGISTTDDFARLLDDTDVRLIFITAPNHLHAPLTLAALEAGKAVMCEKPMGLTLEDAAEMVACAERTGGFLQIGFELRYSRLYLWTKERIEAGCIGDVLNTTCTYLCSEFHGKKSWRNLKSDGGGMFGEKLCHYVDLPRWWIGSPVVDVHSICAPNAIPYYEVRDNYHTTCRHANGAVSHLSFIMAAASTVEHDPFEDTLAIRGQTGHELRYIIQGRAGVIETNIFELRLRRWAYTDAPDRLRSELVEELTWQPGLHEDNLHIHNTSDQALDVIRRVMEGLPPYTPPRDSLETMQVVFAAEKSADLGAPVAIDRSFAKTVSFDAAPAKIAP